MGLILRLHNIVSENDFKVEFKNSLHPYPLNEGFIEYGIYTGGTSLIEMYDETSWEFNSIYWIKITDLVTSRFLIKSIHTNDISAFADCFTLEL